MKILIQPTKERNGIGVKKTQNNLNSCELRKVSLSGRDNGYIASVNSSGAVVITGTSWRPNPVNCPVPFEWLEGIVRENWNIIEKMINE